MWRDVAIGFCTWMVSLSLLVGTWVASMYFFGPPSGDRERSMAFIGGGAVPLFMIMFLLILAAIMTPIRVTK